MDAAIRTPDQRVRVFVSSTLGELAEERAAVRAAVEQLHLTPVMFEMGARPHPPQALYRSYLEQSDVFVGVYWERYGWVAPDMTISGLEDEFVLSEGMPRLVYVKRPAPGMEPRLEAMLGLLQEQDTASYRPFRDPDELRDLVLDDLAVLLTERFDAVRGDTAEADRTVRTNLPVPRSTFVGREDLRDEVRRRLRADGDRLVTLTGPGGAGKTRLALEAAAGLVDAFPDGVWFVDLSADHDPDRVFTDVARTAGLPGGADVAPLDVLVQGLRDARVLLVLDNFEQAADAAPGVATLLESCASLTVLVTSRASLRVRGESLVPVPPLALPDRAAATAEAAGQSDAVRLFVDRAAGLVPGFALTDANAGAVAAICDQLDGLPLAIELAAARVNLFGVEELRARLGRRADELGSGARDLPERQQTLRRAIAWSTDLLDDAQREVFALLSVFAGARLPDVEAVAQQVPSLADRDVVGCLASLVEENLVRSTLADDGRPRLSMLNTIRAYAAEQLAAAPDVDAAVRRAHADHYTALSRDWRGRVGPDSRDDVLGVVGVELGNLRTAWDHGVREGAVGALDDLLDLLWWYDDATGNYREATELGRDLLAVLARQPETPERVRDEVALQTSLARSMIAAYGYTAEVEQRILEAIDRSIAVGAASQRFSVLRSLATLHMLRADLASAAVVGVELQQIAEEQGEPALLADAHLVQGIGVAFHDVGEALRHLDASIESFAAQSPSTRATAVQFRVGPNPGVVAPLVSGLLLRRTGSLDRAEQRISEGLRLAEELGHPYSRAYALFHAGLAATWDDDWERVADRVEVLLQVAGDHDYPIWRALGLVLRGTARAHRGEAAEGLVDVEAGFALYTGLANPPVFWPELLTVRARGLLAAGRIDDALHVVDEAARVVQHGDPQEPEIELVRASIHLARHEPDVPAAEVALERAAELAARSGARTSLLVATTRLAELRRDRPGAADARTALRDVLDGFTEGFDTVPLKAARALLEGSTQG